MQHACRQRLGGAAVGCNQRLPQPSMRDPSPRAAAAAGTIPREWSAEGTFPLVSLMTLHFNNLTGALPEPVSWPNLQVL